MLKSFGAGGLLLLTSALVSPAVLAQTADAGMQLAMNTAASEADAEADTIVVRGRNIPEPIRATPEVISVLSTEDISRSGEGDIAGALQRVTGLSLVGGRFVYVRGLGERYSLALLNGSHLPSPEPLRRVVPLDIFPTSILEGTVVQKSYSVNYPGEFGGGVIDLTTKAVPDEPFLTVSGGFGMNSETTGKTGYTYFGSDTDVIGFDDGSRDMPAGLRDAYKNGKLLFAGADFTANEIKAITASLNNAGTNLIQRNRNIQPDFSIDISGGTAFDVGDVRFGVLASAGIKNGWQTRSGLQQVSGGASVGPDGQPFLNPDVNFRFLSTENRVVVNGMLAFGAEFGEHKLRWTNLYIRDSLKEARIQTGTDEINVGDDLLNRNYTSWFERQLIDTQLSGEFNFNDLKLELRGTYANSQRESPYERVNSYRYSEEFGDFYNDLRTNGTSSTIAFSDLSDNVWSGAIDLSYKVPTERDLTLSAGYEYLDNTRSATRLDYRYLPTNALPGAVSQQRPDYLLSDYNVYTYDILLTQTSANAGVAAYKAGLRVHAGYLQAEAEVLPLVRATVGVRYEDGREFVTPLDIYNQGGGLLASSTLKKDYWLPAATVTWNFYEDMQLRLAASKTIARPQFRELAPQQYLDNESDRTFFGNQYLTDSKLLNFEGRYEWYFATEQRLSVAGFYKKIDRPIETVAFQQGGTFFTTFANAPEATLYGVELEVQKYVPLEGLFNSDAFASRRLVLIGNYTYSKSEIKVGAGDTTLPVTSAGVPVAASDLFVDGTPLTGQSKHLVNVQIGIEDEDTLSQQMVMLTYTSNRVTNRGPSGQPDLVERPGVRLDFVARQGIEIGKLPLELKFEARNLTNEDYEESQTLGASRLYNNFYDIGRSFSLGITAKF